MRPSPVDPGSRKRRRIAQGFFGVGIGFVAASTITLFLTQPPNGAVAAAEEPSDATIAPPDAPTPTATPLPSPSPTFPPDQIDESWPDNPPWDACPAPVWPGELGEGEPGNGRRVLIIGDSLTRESQEAMTEFLYDSGWTPTFRCWGSKRLDWGLDQLERAKAMKQVPEHVLVALGTNDISWEQPATTEARVNTMLDRIGPKRQVLWVDLDIAYSEFSIARADWFNGMIRKVANERPNVTVVPWEKIARAEGIGRFDGIHYGPQGYRFRARTLTDALNERAIEVESTKG